MNPKEKLIEMLSLNRYGKGCNNDELINLFEEQAKEIKGLRFKCHQKGEMQRRLMRDNEECLEEDR